MESPGRRKTLETQFDIHKNMGTKDINGTSRFMAKIMID